MQATYLRNFNRGLESQWERDVRTSRYETWEWRCPDTDCDGHYDHTPVRMETYMGQTFAIDDTECPVCGTEMEVY